MRQVLARNQYGRYQTPPIATRSSADVTNAFPCPIWMSASRPLGYGRVYLPLCKVADTPFHGQEDEVFATRQVFHQRNVY